MISAGPTVEDLDPVRFVGNRSSGKMGFALAERAKALGAKVTLVAGPVNLPTPVGVQRVDVRSALSMRSALWQALSPDLSSADALIMTAAVADYRPAESHSTKLKRGPEPLHLELLPNPDLLAEIGHARKDQKPVLIGFALETDVDEKVIQLARGKLAAKHVDSGGCQSCLGIARQGRHPRDAGQPDRLQPARAAQQGTSRRSHPRLARHAPAGTRLMRVLLTLALTFAGMAYSFSEARAGSPWFWLGVSLPYVLLVLLALHKMWAEGTLLDLLTPRWGDLSIGAVSMMGLLFASWAARKILSPVGSPRQAWLFRIYLQLGNPEHLQRSTAYTLLILAICAAEEIVWRGMVLGDLTLRFGRRAALPLSALAYGFATLPTLWLLRDPIAGPNPLFITAAIGCGLVWSFLAAQLGRLTPVVISHMAFTYFTIVQFRLPGL